ncbi:hypothetical protein PDJAM_G00004750 [Pangasius djambal]|uniref:Uncharacterized protein n=1 Tax=Pangasius djambal TaxID=1691987 RepID=A0ACC5XZ63_9TELE|nr:hypothetical protein [Pangasius djambal]
MAVDWLGYGFAALTATGGIIGYIKAGTYGTLAVLMGVRFLSSWKIMPAGLITGASLFMVLRLGLGFLWPRKTR